MDRRNFLSSCGALGAGLILCGGPASALVRRGEVVRAIPSTGELLPVIGMGSWITFNVGRSNKLRAARLKVLEAFFAAGGAVVDSSPMYGSSEEVIGWCLERLGAKDNLFSATKVWTVSKPMGLAQMETSERLWGEKPFDLLQVHNLLDWETHLETLKAWKAENRVRYIGVTTSHGRRHDELEQIMKGEPLDFVQLTYNVADREAEKRLLPLAADRGIGVIVNRPFRRGSLIDALKGHPLPDWASEFDCQSWPQFLLKFIVSHPAVTCAIPATSRVDHMNENMAVWRGGVSGYGMNARLPDAATRKRMITHVENL